MAQCERAEIEGGSFERAERNLRSKHDALFLEGSPRGSHKYTLSQTCKIMSNIKGREKRSASIDRSESVLEEKILTQRSENLELLLSCKIWSV